MVTERASSEEEILEAIEKAENEMTAAGIVAVGDICNNTSNNCAKTKKESSLLQFY